MTFPSIHELNEVFQSYESCINYLTLHNILYNSMKCPRHNRKMSKSTKSWRCTKRYFNREYSILHQSFFADSKIQVNNTMLILYLKLANTPSASN